MAIIYDYAHWAMVALCILALVMAAQRGKLQFEDSRNWPLVPAQILDGSLTSTEPAAYRLQVEYHLNGARHSSYVTSDLDPTPQIGESVLVRVNPKKSKNVLLWAADNA